MERNLRKTRVGKVVSNKMDKTIVVAIEDHVKHPLYKKIVKVKDANKNLRSWSNSAEVKATATGTKPAISVKSTKKGVATVSWKAVAGADGYDVYCGSSKKSQKGTVVKGTTKLTANKTKLTSGKTYYFRARAYKMVGSAKVYTGYSAVKSVKVK